MHLRLPRRFDQCSSANQYCLPCYSHSEFGNWPDCLNQLTLSAVFAEYRLLHACRRNNISGQLFLRDLPTVLPFLFPSERQFTTAVHQYNTNPYITLAKLSIASGMVLWYCAEADCLCY